MKLPIAERFKSVQGEGLYTGTPMAFIRFVGCSVGKGTCTQCDTDFDKVYPEKGGGLFTTPELLEWVGDFPHICFTGGEPFDRDLLPLCDEIWRDSQHPRMIHFETSGTREIPVAFMIEANDSDDPYVWITVSPKPGYLIENVRAANEIKVILGGLGPGDGWPTLDDAIEWASWGKLVYLQPPNHRHEPCLPLVNEAHEACMRHPALRLSVQLHKFLQVR